MSIGPLHVDTRKLGSTAFDGPYIVVTINKAEFRFVHKLNTKKTQHFLGESHQSPFCLMVSHSRSRLVVYPKSRAVNPSQVDTWNAKPCHREQLSTGLHI